jgi:hypothetical protein
MLKEHLQVCREDDDTDIIELGRMADLDSEDDDDGNIDDPDYNTDSSLLGINCFINF